MSLLNIIYYCGPTTIWSTYSLPTNITEAQNAVRFLVDDIARCDKVNSVNLFANFIEPFGFDHKLYCFSQDEIYSYIERNVINGENGKCKYVLIVMGIIANQFLPTLIQKFGSDVIRERFSKIIWDNHDALNLPEQFSKNIYPYVDTIMFKSRYHASLFDPEVLHYEFPNIKSCEIVGNGVFNDCFILSAYHNYKRIERDKYSMCYDGDWGFGLYPLLKYIFPQIRKRIPQMKLFVMYTQNYPSYMDDHMVDEFKELLNQDGVKYREGIYEIEKTKIKQQCSFDMHFTNNSMEIDCVSIKESAVLGVVPIISNEGVFKDRYGAHYSIDDLKGMIDFIDDFVNKKTDEEREIISETIMNTNFKNDSCNPEPILSCREVACVWLNIILK